VHSGIFKSAVFTMILSVALPSMVFGADRTLTLKNALSIALTDNPEIKAQSQALLAYGEDIGIAQSYLLPKLTLEERFIRTTSPSYAFSFKMNQERFSAADLMGAPDTFNNPGATSDFQSTLSFEQPLFAPKAYIGIDMAKKEAKARSIEFGRKKEEIALKVYKTYVGIATATAYLAAAEKGVEDAKAHLSVAEVRYKEGIGIYSDLLRTRVAVSMAAERHVSAIKNRDIAKRALGLMLGLEESVDISAEIAEGELKAIEDYYGMSSLRKDLNAMENRVANAGNMLKMADAGYLPVIGVGAAYQMNDHKKPFASEGDSWQIMAFLKWDIFDGMKREHERQKAKYKIAEAQEYLGGMKKEIAFNIYEAYLGVGEARESLALARTALLSAEEGVRIVKVRYENSLSPMIELLDIQAELDASRAGVIEKESAFKSAIANLWFHSGIILKELGLEQ